MSRRCVSRHCVLMEPEEAAEAMEQVPEPPPAVHPMWVAAGREQQARLLLQEAMRQYEAMTRSVSFLVSVGGMPSLDSELIAQCQRVLDYTMVYADTLVCLIRAHENLPRGDPATERRVPTPPPPPPRPSSSYDKDVR